MEALSHRPICTRKSRSFVRRRAWLTFVLCAVALAPPLAAPPAFVDITWMSISNMYYELGPLNIITDGYITRLPRDAFSAAVEVMRRRSGHSSRMWPPSRA